MRTYSHAILTYAAFRLVDDSKRDATLAALGATLPDLPAGVGAVWLWTRKRAATREDFDTEVCGRNAFRVPDAAAHSFPVLLAAMLASRKSGVGSAFLLGWAGHLAVDFLTHSSDARPQLWPLSGWHFRSSVSYRERERHGRAFTAVEHALLLFALFTLLLKRNGEPGSGAARYRV